MTWAIGWDSNYQRWKGYGVPCVCEHPGCSVEIHRGLAHVCAGCSMYFCDAHGADCYCKRCEETLLDDDLEPIKDAQIDPYPCKPELEKWLQHLETDASWEEWRNTAEGRAHLARWRAQA